jgi:hypothetical protein
VKIEKVSVAVYGEGGRLVEVMYQTACGTTGLLLSEDTAKKLADDIYEKLSYDPRVAGYEEGPLESVIKRQAAALESQGKLVQELTAERVMALVYLDEKTKDLDEKTKEVERLLLVCDDYAKTIKRGGLNAGKWSQLRPLLRDLLGIETLKED